MPSLHQIGLMHELLKYNDFQLAMWAVVIAVVAGGGVFLFGRSLVRSIHINCDSMRHWLITKLYKSWNIYENPLFIRLEFFASFIFTAVPFHQCFDSVNICFEIWHMVYSCLCAPARMKISQLRRTTLELMSGHWNKISTTINSKRQIATAFPDVFCMTFMFPYLHSQLA